MPLCLCFLRCSLVDSVRAAACRSAADRRSHRGCLVDFGRGHRCCERCWRRLHPFAALRPHAVARILREQLQQQSQGQTSHARQCSQRGESEVSQQQAMSNKKLSRDESHEETPPCSENSRVAQRIRSPADLLLALHPESCECSISALNTLCSIRVHRCCSCCRCRVA